MDGVLQAYEAELRGLTLVLFDGVCVMCNRTIRVLMRNDPAGRLRFTPIEGALGQAMLGRHPELAVGHGGTSDRTSLDSVVVMVDVWTPGERVYLRSEAAIRAMRQLRRPWPLAARLLGWVPRFVRDAGYKVVARLRYPVFGKLPRCPVPTEAERGRILGV